jgi:hypothetical protein
LNFLDDLKAVAERAELNSGGLWLHKFRATRVDLRTVQQWQGHPDMESTMRYLKPSRSQACSTLAVHLMATAAVSPKLAVP